MKLVKRFGVWISRLLWCFKRNNYKVEIVMKEEDYYNSTNTIIPIY